MKTLCPALDLRQYLDQLRAAGELAEVAEPVDPDQELAEIHRRTIAEGGPALLFTNVVGSQFPVATNLFGTRERVERAFGLRPLQWIERLAHTAEAMAAPSLRSAWSARGLAWRALRLGTRRRANGSVKQVVERPPDLNRLPIPTCWPGDGGPFLTLPLVLTRSPRDGRMNLAIYRNQRHDAQTFGMHWQIGKGGGFHHHEARERGEALPAAIFLGGPPAATLAAAAPLPEGVCELLLTSLMLERRVAMTPAPLGLGAGLGPLPLLAEAEFAFIGHVPPEETRPEGPFGDHYGYYSLRHDYPIFRCEAVCRRRDAIYPATVVGRPPQEDYFLGEYLQRLLLPLTRLVMPGLRDLWSYAETGFHPLVAAVTRERYRHEAMTTAFRILGEGQLALTKFLLLTDTPRDLSDFPGLLAHVLARFDPERDLHVFDAVAMDTLDYTGPAVNEGSKGVMLGLGAARRELPRAWDGAPPPRTRDPRVFCAGCLVVGGPRYEDAPEFGRELASSSEIASWPLVVLCDDPARATASTVDFLWTTFTRFEPAADLHAARSEVVRNRLVRRGPLVVDARMKPSYPDEVRCDPAVAQRVANAGWDG